MKKFEPAKLEVVEFNAQDVIVTSGTPCSWDTTGGGTEDSCGGINQNPGGQDDFG